MKIRFALLFLAVNTAPAAASVLDISSANITEGLAQLKLGGLAAQDASKADAYEYKIEGEYAPTSYWRTAVEGTYNRSGGNATEYGDTTIKNVFQFMRQGDDVMSSAVRFDYKVSNIDTDPDRMAARLMVQRSFGDISGLANVIAKRDVGSNAADETKGEVRAAVRYTYNTWFRPSVEYLADFGSLNHPIAYRNQSHRIGPVAYFSLDKKVGVELGYFAGISENATDSTFKINIGIAVN